MRILYICIKKEQQQKKTTKNNNNNNNNNNNKQPPSNVTNSFAIASQGIDEDRMRRSGLVIESPDGLQVTSTGQGTGYRDGSYSRKGKTL